MEEAGGSKPSSRKEERKVERIAQLQSGGGGGIQVDLPRASGRSQGTSNEWNKQPGKKSTRASPSFKSIGESTVMDRANTNVGWLAGRRDLRVEIVILGVGLFFGYWAAANNIGLPPLPWSSQS